MDTPIKFHQPVEGRGFDVSYLQGKALSYGLQDVAEMVSHRADEVDGQPVVPSVHQDVTLEETHEFLVDQSLHHLLLDVCLDEGNEARQETVGEGLAVDLFQDTFGRQTICLEEGLDKLRGHLPLQAIAYELTAQDRPASLVAQDKAQRRNLFANLMPIVKARVRTCSEDAGNTCLCAA